LFARYWRNFAYSLFLAASIQASVQSTLPAIPLVRTAVETTGALLTPPPPLSNDTVAFFGGVNSSDIFTVNSTTDSMQVNGYRPSCTMARTIRR